MPAPDPDILAEFLTESGELIETLDRDLVALERSPGSEDLVNSAFRAMHTIKGSGSFLALDALTGVAHAAEDVLNLVRKHEVEMSAALMSSLLESVDVIRGQLDELAAGDEVSVGPAALLDALQSFAAGAVPDAGAGAAVLAAETPADGDALQLPQSKLDLLDFMVDDLDASLEQLRSGLRELEMTPGDADATAPLATGCEELVRSVEFFELDEMLAEVEAIATSVAALPELTPAAQAQTLPRTVALHDVLTQRSAALAGSRVLSCDTTVLRDRLSRLAGGEQLAEDERLPEGCEAEEALGFDAASSEAPAPDPTHPEGSTPTQPGEAGPPANAPRAESSIRVDVARLESLLNLVGELVLEKNRVLALSRLRGAGDTAFHEQLEQVASDLDRVTSDLQLSVMKTRMQPMNKLFSRYPRVIRDLSSTTGKDIDLEIIGGDTEVDKSVIELLADPMVHLLRNCADHGVESADERAAADKSRRGRVVVEASHEGSHVVVSIKDDGRGIDHEQVAAKAVEKGLITAEDAGTMGRQDLIRLVFSPGFSTASEVTGLSGRGVGMDVVHNNIIALNGLIDLESEIGVGTTVTFRIPLTLAIMQAMMTEAADAVYAIPLNNVIEIVEPEQHELPSVRGVAVLRLRDEVIPLVDLREVLGGEPAAEDGSHVIVVGIGERRMGLRADGLVGQQEIVIKPLDPIFDGNRLVSGATVREDGGVSLILDVGAIVDQNHGRCRGAVAASALKKRDGARS